MKEIVKTSLMYNILEVVTFNHSLLQINYKSTYAHDFDSLKMPIALILLLIGFLAHFGIFLS